MPRFSEERKAMIDATVKQKVLDAVIRILNKYHSSKITIGMLAEESGISIGTLYNHFRNKDEIIVYAIKKIFGPMNVIQAEIIGSDMSVPDKLRAIIEKNIKKDSALLKLVVLMANNMSASNASRPVAVLNSLRRRTMARLDGVLAEGVRQGLFRDIEMKYLGAAFLGVRKGNDIRRRRLSPGENRPVAEDVEKVMDIFMHGTAARRQRIVSGIIRNYTVSLGNKTKDRVFRAVMSVLRSCHIDRLSVDSISMNMIAERVGISKPVLYKHFKNKDDLFAYVMRKSLEPHEKAKMEAVESNMSIPEKLVAFAEADMNRNDDTEKIFLIASQSAFLPSFRKTVEELWQHSNECLTVIIQQGLREGFFREIDANDLVSYFTGIIMVFIGYKAYHENRKFVAKDVAMIVDVFLNGTSEPSSSRGNRRK